MSEESSSDAIGSAVLAREIPRNAVDHRNVEEMDYERSILDRARTNMDAELKENMSDHPAEMESLAPESEEEEDMDDISSLDEESVQDSQNSPQVLESQRKEPSAAFSLASVTVAAANPKTIKTYQSHVRVFKEWLRSEGLPEDFEYCSAAELSSWLLKFYRDGRRKDGGEWKPSSLKIIRFAINQHLHQEPFNRTMSITRDEQFKEANSIISAKQKELQQLGLDATGTRESKESAKPLTSEDVRQLWMRGIIGVSSPKQLHRFAFMIVAVNFGITARIGLHLLRPAMFRFGVDENSGLPFAQYNPKGEHNPNPKKATKANRRMFGIPGSSQCPVAALKLYIQKLNNDGTESFFHTPNRHYKETGVWYTPQPTGKNTLGRLMKDIAVEGKLPYPYTNHSLRYTSPFVFFQAVQGGSQELECTPYRSSDGKVKFFNAKLPSISPRPLSRVTSRPPALRKIETATNGEGAAEKQVMPLSVTQSANGSIVVHHKPSSLVALPVSSMAPTLPVSPPALKRRRVLSPPPNENPFRYSNPALTSTPINNVHAGPFSRSACLSHEFQPRCSSPSAIKAHHVLCVPQKWEMSEIMKVLNSGDALILSRNNLREKRFYQGEHIKNEASEQADRFYRDTNLDAEMKQSTFQAECRARDVPQGTHKYNDSMDLERESQSPPVSGMQSSRSSRKQTVPKKLVKLENDLIEKDDEIENLVAYDEAIQSITSKLTVLEYLHKTFTPSREHVKRLQSVKERLNNVATQALLKAHNLEGVHNGEAGSASEESLANGFSHI